MICKYENFTVFTINTVWYSFTSKRDAFLMLKAENDGQSSGFLPILTRNKLADAN